jgi:hypothetical protein
LAAKEKIRTMQRTGKALNPPARVAALGLTALGVWFALGVSSGVSYLAFAAEATVTSTVDRDVLAPGDTLTLSVSVDSEGSPQIGQPRWPDFQNFEVINTWSGTEVQSVFENGRFLTKKRQTFNLQILAQRAGVFEVGAVEVAVDGQAYRTKPLKVTVREDAPATQARPRRNAPAFPGFPSEDEISGLDDMFNQLLKDRMRRFGQRQGVGSGIDDGADINAPDIFFLDVEVDKDKVYVGEQVTVNFYLYTRGRISDIDTLKYPVLAGFWKEDIELATRLNFSPVIRKGVQYNRALLASYALFPIKPGIAKIDPYRAKCTIVSGNPFAGAGTRQLTKESAAVNITVSPLPEAGKPADFLGAVGRFTLEVKGDTLHPKVNQPVTVTVRFQGQGNAKLIELPKLQLPPALELYDTKNEAKFFKDGTSFKQFDMLVIPRQAGPSQIPGLSVSLFDPDKKQYYTLTSEPLTLDVAPADPGAPAPAPPSNFSKTGSGEGNAPVKLSLPPVLAQYDGPPSGLRGASSAEAIWFSAYALVILGLTWLSRRELGWGQRKQTLRRLILRRIENMKTLLKKGEHQRAASEALNLIYRVLGEVSQSGGGSKDIQGLLRTAPPSFRKENETRLLSLVGELEVFAYAPASVAAAMGSAAGIQSAVEKTVATTEALLLRALDTEFSEDLTQ